jgi:hypothetical protein
MDIDTTSINELPIINNTSSDMGREQYNNKGENSSDHITMDVGSLPQNSQSQSQKQVRFSDTDVTEPLGLPKKRDEIVREIVQEEIKADIHLEYKFVILATVIFFLFMDPKMKRYLMNILVQIFGNFLKTEHGNFTQIGIMVYSMFFGVILITIMKTVDISSFHLSL